MEKKVSTYSLKERERYEEQQEDDTTDTGTEKENDGRRTKMGKLAGQQRGQHQNDGGQQTVRKEEDNPYMTEHRKGHEKTLQQQGNFGLSDETNQL